MAEQNKQENNDPLSDLAGDDNGLGDMPDLDGIEQGDSNANPENESQGIDDPLEQDGSGEPKENDDGDQDIDSILSDSQLSVVDMVEKFSEQLISVVGDPDLVFKGIQKIIQDKTASQEQIKSIVDNLRLTRNIDLQGVADKLSNYYLTERKAMSKSQQLRSLVNQIIKEELKLILKEEITTPPQPASAKLDVEAALQLDVDASQAILDFSKLIRKHLKLPEVNDMDSTAQEIYVGVINDLKLDLKKSVINAIKRLSSVPKIKEEGSKNSTEESASDIFPAKVN